MFVLTFDLRKAVKTELKMPKKYILFTFFSVQEYVLSVCLTLLGSNFNVFYLMILNKHSLVFQGKFDINNSDITK